MKKFLFPMGLFFVVLVSCESEINDVKDEDSLLEESNYKRPVFKNWDEYYSAYRELNKLAGEELVLNQVSGKDYSSFLNQAIESNEEETLKVADELSVSLMALMNEQHEFQIGDSIISYSDGNFHKSLPGSEDATVIDNIQVVSYNSEDGFSKQNSLASKIVLSGGNAGGVSGHNFTRQQYLRCSDNAKIKGVSDRPMYYLQQLKAERVGYTAALWIETRLYWRNKRKRDRIEPAGPEERNYVYNVNGTLAIDMFSAAGVRHITEQINIQDQVYCTTSKFGRYFIADAFPSIGSWTINLSGTISHHINGDAAANKWVAPVNW